MFVYLLLERRLIFLDLFLLFFLDEIEDGFINGIVVDNYSFILFNFFFGFVILRYFILCVIGDYVVICEVCKGIFCGKNFCCCCKCGSILDFGSNYYYYGNY